MTNLKNRMQEKRKKNRIEKSSFFNEMSVEYKTVKLP